MYVGRPPGDRPSPLPPATGRHVDQTTRIASQHATISRGGAATNRDRTIRATLPPPHSLVVAV